jgi:UMF1 family MFS transporter
MMGVLTTMFMAATYGEKQLGLKEDVLIPTVLIIQLVGMLGAWMFSRLSGRLGNLPALLISIAGWSVIVVGAFYITNTMHFLIVAFFIGIVMGGSQSLARSTYSKMLPADTTDHTSFFSFYDVMEKLATVAGTFSFGVIEAVTGSMRYSVLAITLFFVISLFFILLLYRKTLIEAKLNQH